MNLFLRLDFIEFQFMNKIRAILFVLILPFIASVNGQTSDSRDISLAYPVYSQYLQNGLLVNPAYAGSEEHSADHCRTGCSGWESIMLLYFRQYLCTPR